MATNIRNMLTALTNVRFLMWLLIFVGLMICENVPSFAAPIKQMYVFGDSYSDSGRGFADNDGPTAVVYLAHRLGFQIVPSTKRSYRTESLNFAVAGASTGSNDGYTFADRQALLDWHEESGCRVHGHEAIR